MQRMKRTERGATAVLVALMMVTLLGVAAIAVDMGALWWDRKQLQNGADAAALGIAQDCASSEECPPSFYDPYDEAKDYANANKTDGGASAVHVDAVGNRVTVKLSAQREAWFSRFLGRSGNGVTASATAEFQGVPGRLTTFPLAVSKCQFEWQKDPETGELLYDDVALSPGAVVRIELLSDTKKGPAWSAEGETRECAEDYNEGAASGGFGFLDPDSKDSCQATTTLNPDGTVTMGSKTGFLPCVRDALKVGDEIQIPLFDQAWKPGGTAYYRIVGFAALRITANELKGVGNSYIEGVFLYRGALSDLVTTVPDADFGLTVVRLVK